MPTLKASGTSASFFSKFDLNKGPLLDLTIEVGEPKLSLLKKAGDPIPPPLRLKGLIDTGATGVAIDYSYAVALKLQPTDFTPCLIPGSRKYAPAIFAKITVMMEPHGYAEPTVHCF